MSHERPMRAEDAIAQLKRGSDRLTTAEPTPKRPKSEVIAETTVSSAGNAVESLSPSASSAAVVEALLGTTKGGLSVNNAPVLEEVAGFPRRALGSVVYAPQKLLARGHELDYNGVLQVRISHHFLNTDSDDFDVLRRRALWGTDIYTDDSDLIGVLYHLGYLPLQPTKTAGKPNDLLVEILLLPVLKEYVGTNRNILSRSWLKVHDGISYMVLKPPKTMPMGWATAGKDGLYDRFNALKELRQGDVVRCVEI